MSMDFSEFKRRIGAEPRSRDPELERARALGAEFEEAAREADAFESVLEKAARVDAPGDLLDAVLTIPDAEEAPVGKTPSASRRGWMPWALAASLLVAVGAAGIAWQQTQRLATVEAYLADHYGHDGAAVLARAGAGEASPDVNEILAAFDVAADPGFAGRVRFVKYCPTPSGRGAHMVLDTPQGLVTLIFMPDTKVEDRDVVAFDGHRAYLVALERGAAAVIGENALDTGAVDTLVRGAIHPVSVDA